MESKETNEDEYTGLTQMDILQIMASKQDEYTEAKTVTVFCGTWNVNAKKSQESLKDWLIPPIRSNSPDIYCIGFQEVVDLNGPNLAYTSIKSAEPWMDQIRETIGDKYKTLCFKQLVGILLIIYVRSEVFPQVSETLWDTAGVGIMGVAGNKGAVAIRFKVYNTSVCVICSHLAAHQHNVQGRNSDFHNISQRITFEDRTEIKNHDYVFWLGDLNYRLNIDEDWDESWYEKIENSEMLGLLLAKDQLNCERLAGRVFEGYDEGPINFKPTYKYQPGTNEYERRPEKKFRIPAWCDRILWIGKRATQVVYFRAEMNTSDHKPVGAMFEIAAKVVIKEKENELYQSLIRRRDDQENENIAKVQLSSSQIDFGILYYDKQITKTINVVNTGKVYAKFFFDTELHETHPCKSWLRIDPQKGVLDIGRSVEIKLTVRVTREVAPRLNTGIDILEDILIFRLFNGIHYFISVSGQYQKSCFGCPIDCLVRIPTPIRFYQKEHFIENPSKILSIPKELWRIVDYIYRHGLGEQNLFSSSGSYEEKEAIRDALDTGDEFGAVSVHSMAEVLLDFLTNLPQPVYPKSLCERWNEKNDSISHWAKRSLMELPLANYNVFIYLIAFFRETVRHGRSEININPAIALAQTTVTPALVHVNPFSENAQESKAAQIIVHFLSATEFG